MLQYWVTASWDSMLFHYLRGLGNMHNQLLTPTYKVYEVQGVDIEQAGST